MLIDTPIVWMSSVSHLIAIKRAFELQILIAIMVSMTLLLIASVT